MLQIREEVSFTKGRIIVRGKLVTRGKAKRADYILYYKPNIPIALIEAKDNNHSVGDGMQQAPRIRRRRSTSPSSSPRTATASSSTTAPARAPTNGDDSRARRLPVARPISGRATAPGRA